MKAHGITIDTRAIAQGVWDMMPNEDRAPMVLGMIPLRWHEMVERMTREKLAGEYRKRYHVTPQDDSLFLLEEDFGETFGEFMREVMRQFSLDLLHCAKEAGVMVV